MSPTPFDSNSYAFDHQPECLLFTIVSRRVRLLWSCFDCVAINRRRSNRFQPADQTNLVGKLLLLPRAGWQQTRGRLRLDIREDAVEHGAINPDELRASELLSRIFSEDAELVMPPPNSNRVLSIEQKELVRKWIEQGLNTKSTGPLFPQRSPQSPGKQTGMGPQSH